VTNITDAKSLHTAAIRPQYHYNYAIYAANKRLRFVGLLLLEAMPV